MKPRILLSVNSKKENYTDAVNNCGGVAVPVYCPDLSEISSDDYDGLIVCGGNDINPIHYNEEINGSVNIDDKRDLSELELIKMFTAAKKPVFGICRGFQILNVFFGGSLFQDIENAKEHSSFSDYDLTHNVKAEKNSFIYNIYGEEFTVNSFHHQALKDVGKGFEVVLMAEDNCTIEGIAHKNLPIIGVQWHPERMCFSKKREDTADGSKIFDYFINMCK